MIAINIKRSRDDFAVAEHIDRFFCVFHSYRSSFLLLAGRSRIGYLAADIRELCMTVMAKSYKCCINMGFRLD